MLNGYFVASRRIEDCDGLAALPLFMSLRAAIRAKVTAARLGQAGAGQGIATSAKRYFQFALDLLSPATPRLICTAGLSGTGKSVLAQSLAPLLAPMPGALVLRSDVDAQRVLAAAMAAGPVDHFGFESRKLSEVFREAVAELVAA